jgi:hypothetical protein
MTESSRQKAYTWPYKRHQAFEVQLRQSNANWFAARGLAVNKKYPYILERWENWPQNIIRAEVAEYIQAEQKKSIEAGSPFPLHQYVHHGLSSQAMLFNLVGPLIVQNNFFPMQRAFEAAEIPWPVGTVKANFEVENRSVFNEDSGQPTSIDLEIQAGDNSRPLFIESKLVEREFGGCSVLKAGDCDGRNPTGEPGRCYLHHIGRRYWELLKQHGFLDGPAGVGSICPMALYYQFFRELLFSIELGGDFVLLYDKRNPTFYANGPTGKRGLVPFLISFVPEHLHRHVHQISLQQMVDAFKATNQLEWLPEFEKKYAL